MAPSEFWRLTPTEWVWIYEAKAPAGAAGRLTGPELEELYEMLEDGEQWPE